MWPLSILSLLAPELWFSAGRLELDAERWRAEQVELRAEGFELSAAGASGGPSAACPTAALVLRGPLAARGGGRTLGAASGEVCLPGGAVSVEALDLSGPGLRLGADRARLAGAEISADGVWASRCGCADPPWRVSADRVEGALDRGVWASWPVLWAGGVPVAAAPAWYVPLGERRSGLLAPRLGWDGELGPWGHLPFYWAPARSLDLTIAPGYRHGLGAAGRGRLRWASSPADRGDVDGEYVLGEGLELGGQGSAAWGSARLAVAGGLSTDLAVREAVRASVDARRADYQAASAGLSVSGAQLGAGVRVAWLQDLRGLDADLRRPLPESWLSWAQGLGPALARFTGRHARLGGEAATDVVDLGVEGTLVHWLGPLRLHPEVGAATTLVADETGSDQATLGYAIAAATFALGRSYRAARHEVHFTGRGLFAASRGVAAPRDFDVGPSARPLDRRGVEGTVSNRLVAADWSGQLDVTAGYEAEAPVAGRLPVLVQADFDARWLAVTGIASELDFVAADARLGDLDGYYLGAELNRLRLDARSALLRPAGRPRQLLSAAPDSTTGGARLGASLGPLRLEYGLVADLEDNALVGQQGALTYLGRCDCWSLRLDATHQAGRDRPDVWLGLSL